MSFFDFRFSYRWPVDIKERPPQYHGVVAIEKGAFGSPSTMVTNFLLYVQKYLRNFSTQLCT